MSNYVFFILIAEKGCQLAFFDKVFTPCPLPRPVFVGIVRILAHAERMQVTGGGFALRHLSGMFTSCAIDTPRPNRLETERTFAGKLAVTEGV